MAGKAPNFAERQFWLDQQRQTIGQPIGSVDNGTAVAGQMATQNVSPVVQRIVDSVIFNTINFSGSLYLAYNPRRTYLLMQNSGGAVMYVEFTGLNGTFTSGLQIAIGGYYEPFKCPINAVGISGSSGYVIEGVPAS